MTNTGLATYPEIYMPCPFAGEADAGGTSGTNRSKPFSDSKSAANVNMRTGFPTVFTLAQSANGKYLSRPDMNQLGYMATLGQFRKQIGCLNEFNSSFAATIDGYAKGAVLDYVVWLDQPNNVIGEVWKIVSLKDKNKDAPSSSNILTFGTSKEAASGMSWLRVVPDKAYIEAVQAACNSYADSAVKAESDRAKGVEGQKINTSTANAKFTNGIPKERSGWKTTTPNDGCIDGTALDKEGKECEVNVAIATSGLVDQYTSPILGRNVPIAKYGHVHTNMYTKAEVDAKIGAMGGEFASGVDQIVGFHDGTYSSTTSGSTTIIKGHKHTDSCANSYSTSFGTNSHDGTAYQDSTRRLATNEASLVVVGHIHTNLATKESVYSKTESDSYFARGGGRVGSTDCTARDTQNNIIDPTYSGTKPRGSYANVNTGHYHTNYATTEYVGTKFEEHIRDYPHGESSSITFLGSNKDGTRYDYDLSSLTWSQSGTTQFRRNYNSPTIHTVQKQCFMICMVDWDFTDSNYVNSSVAVQILINGAWKNIGLALATAWSGTTCYCFVEQNTQIRLSVSHPWFGTQPGYHTLSIIEC